MRPSSWHAGADFEDLVAAHRSAWLRLAIVLTGSPSDAEDVVQEALISVARAWSRVRADGAAAYVRKAIVRKAIDQRRGVRDVPVGEPGGHTTYDNVLRFEEDRRFLELLQELNPKQRVALVCRYYLDLDDRTTARLMRCTESTVRSHVRRGQLALRLTLGELASSDEGAS